MTQLRIGGIPVGRGAPLVLIAGLNVIESESAAVACAETLASLAAAHGLPLVFKASFDKANRSGLDSFRGPGLEKGLAVLEAVKHKTGLPLLTDVHDPGQSSVAARVVDCLQIPAFLCRQTDLLLACAQTGLPINIKKGQFVAPGDIHLAVEKVRAQENSGGVMLTERGTSFGHNDLVVDMRGLLPMREVAPLCFDATHAAQYPGAGDNASGGDRRFVVGHPAGKGELVLDPPPSERAATLPSGSLRDAGQRGCPHASHRAIDARAARHRQTRYRSS